MGLSGGLATNGTSPGGGGAGAVTSVAGKVGAVTLVEGDIGSLVADLAAKSGFGDAGWTAPSFVNGWTAGTPAVEFRKDGQGIVHMHGQIISPGTLTVAFTLPVGYRPSIDSKFTGRIQGGTLILQIDVLATGDVSLATSSGAVANTNWAAFDGITFYAA